MKKSDQPFWIRKKLHEFTPDEWESLCDGCAQCCLYKLEDEETGDIYFTRVVCSLLDLNTCTCTNYAQRSILMPTCVKLTPSLLPHLNWLPETCAYRRIFEGKKLPGWHHLVSGSRDLVQRVGVSVRGKVIPASEINLDDLEDYII